MNKEEIEREWNILIALFRATIEQTAMLKGEVRQHTKMIFNRWNKEGERILRHIESQSWEVDLDEVTDVIHNAVDTLRDEDKH